MTARKAAADAQAAWELSDLQYLQESLDGAEASLQAFSMIKTIDVVLIINDKVVACHHDGQKWWVKFG